MSKITVGTQVPIKTANAKLSDDFLQQFTEQATSAGLNHLAFSVLEKVDREREIQSPDLLSTYFALSVGVGIPERARALFERLDAQQDPNDEQILSLIALEVRTGKESSALQLRARLVKKSILADALLVEAQLASDAKVNEQLLNFVFSHTLRKPVFKLGILCQHIARRVKDATLNVDLTNLVNSCHTDNIPFLVAACSAVGLDCILKAETVSDLNEDTLFWAAFTKPEFEKPRATLSALNATFSDFSLSPVRFDEASLNVLDTIECETFHTRSTEANEPLVSVIICSYNADETLAYALRSIDRQTYKNIEIILVDDCSDCPQRQYVPPTARKLTYILNEKNSGPYLSRNVGLTVASGEFITFHDSDDWAHPQKIERQVSEMQRDGLLAHYASHIRITPNGTLVPENNGRFIGDGPITGMFHKSIFLEIGQFANVRTRGDIEFRRRVSELYASKQIHNSAAPLVLALHWNSNSHTTTSEPQKFSRMAAFKSYSLNTLPMMKFMQDGSNYHNYLDQFT